jgi:hypothetical protein
MQQQQWQQRAPCVRMYALSSNTFLFINRQYELICCSNNRIHFRLENFIVTGRSSRTIELFVYIDKHMDKHSKSLFVNEVEIELLNEVIWSSRCRVHWKDKVEPLSRWSVVSLLIDARVDNSSKRSTEFVYFDIWDTLPMINSRFAYTNERTNEQTNEWMNVYCSSSNEREQEERWWWWWWCLCLIVVVWGRL